MKQLNHNLRVQLKKDTSYVVSVEEKCDAIEDENIKLKETVTDLSEQIDSLNLRLVNYETSTKQLHRQLASKENKIEKMKSKIGTLQSEKEQSVMETKEVDKEKWQLESQLKKTTKAGVVAFAEIANSKIKLKNLSFNEKILQQSLHNLQSQYDTRIDEVKELRKKVPYNTIQRERNFDPEAKGGQQTFPPHIWSLILEQLVNRTPPPHL